MDFTCGPVVPPFNAESMGSIPGWGTRISHALWPKKGGKNVPSREFLEDSLKSWVLGLIFHL